MGTIAVLPLLAVDNPDSDTLHLFYFLAAVGSALYLCAGLLYIPDMIQRALRYRNHREPRRVVEDASRRRGVEATVRVTARANRRSRG